MAVRVILWESERGWGKRIDEIRTFDTREEAVTFADEFNSFNDKDEVPDWYMYAEVEGE